MTLWHKCLLHVLVKTGTCLLYVLAQKLLKLSSLMTFLLSFQSSVLVSCVSAQSWLLRREQLAPPLVSLVALSLVMTPRLSYFYFFLLKKLFNFDAFYCNFTGTGNFDSASTGRWSCLTVRAADICVIVSYSLFRVSILKGRHNP
jgi:hypothetical protein